MIIKDNVANMCAKVTSTYMEFTLAFGPKPEFSFSFKWILLPLQVGDELQKTKERLFCNAIHGIIESVDKMIRWLVKRIANVRFTAGGAPVEVIR